MPDFDRPLTDEERGPFVWDRMEPGVMILKGERSGLIPVFVGDEPGVHWLYFVDIVVGPFRARRSAVKAGAAFATIYDS